MSNDGSSIKTIDQSHGDVSCKGHIEILQVIVFNWLLHQEENEVHIIHINWR